MCWGFGGDIAAFIATASLCRFPVDAEVAVVVLAVAVTVTG